MIDRSSARQAVLRRWIQELNPFRVAVVGALCADGSEALAAELGRHSPRRAWEGSLPARLRPAVHHAASSDDLSNAWDVAICFGLESQNVQEGLRTVEELRRKARFVVVAAPTGGRHAWPAGIRRALRPLAVQSFGGEDLCLLRGGQTAVEGDGPRVWYLAPNRHIYGGVKILYNHVDLLTTLGIDAALAVEGPVNWPAQWFPWDPARLVFAENVNSLIGSDDVVVIPEFRYRDALRYRHVKRRLLFVQNQGFAKGIADWERLGYDGVLTLGRPDGLPSFLEEWLARQRCRLPMFAVPNHFDDDGWHEIAPNKRPGSILCLPRKGPEFVARLVREFGKAVTCVENAHQLEMAAAYATADVYVHTGFPEGLGMPIVESMLAGCVACGFAGGGGLDVMSDGKTAYLAADGDMDELLRAVRRALYSPGREEVRAAGRRAAMRFNRAAAQGALDQCYRRWLPDLPTRTARSRRSLLAAMLGR